MRNVGVILSPSNDVIDYVFFYHAVLMSQPKRLSRLICSQAGIPEKIFVDPPNMRFNHLITYLKAILIMFSL